MKFEGSRVENRCCKILPILLQKAKGNCKFLQNKGKDNKMTWHEIIVKWAKWHLVFIGIYLPYEVKCVLKFKRTLKDS